MSETKEGFCSLCAAVPLALAGLGGTAYAASGAEAARRNVIILIGSAVVLIVLIFLYIKYSKCKMCIS